MPGPVARTGNLFHRWTNEKLTPDGQIGEDLKWLLATVGLVGKSCGTYIDNQPFIYHLPQFPKDYEDGGICPISGYWSAGSGMVEVDGMKCIVEFAPDHVQKPWD